MPPSRHTHESDTEILLSSGMLLGIFFTIAFVCAIFFGFGYSLGRSSGIAANAGGSVAVPVAAPISTPGGSKPSARKASPSADCPAGSTETADCPPAGSDELTFYKSVEQKDANKDATLSPDAAAASPSASNPAPAVNSAPLSSSPAQGGMVSASRGVATLASAAPGPRTRSNTAPELASPAAGFLVQVAAVTRQEDADALVAALRKKNYPVLVLANSPSDRLVRVQVGPFPQLQDAEAMRSRLASDGYNAIVKK